MKSTLTFVQKPIIDLVKAQSATITIQNPKEKNLITDDKKTLLQNLLANAYMNLCGLLLPYLDFIQLGFIESGTLEFILNTGSSRMPPLSIHIFCERYIAAYILKEYYATSAYAEVRRYTENLFKNAARTLLELMAV